MLGEMMGVLGGGGGGVGMRVDSLRFEGLKGLAGF